MRTCSRLLFRLLPLLFTVAACGQRESPASELSEQRKLLSDGYSLLHADASSMQRLEWVIYLKTESAEFEKMARSVSDYGKELQENLERIARDYPGVRIDLKPLPEIEMRKRFAVGKDRAIEFAPLIGRSGAEYERTMLISLSNGLNHESHMCQVLAAEEPDPGLNKFLLECERRYHDLYKAVMALLAREHFRSSGETADRD